MGIWKRRSKRRRRIRDGKVKEMPGMKGIKERGRRKEGE